MLPQRVHSFADLRQFFMELPAHHGDPRIADANHALLKAAYQHIDTPRVPYDLSAADRVFLNAIRVAADA